MTFSLAGTAACRHLLHVWQDADGRWHRIEAQLAQSGAGIASCQFGYFPENVVSARVVLPDSAVRTLSGDDLDLVADAEGITGITPGSSCATGRRMRSA